MAKKVTMLTMELRIVEQEDGSVGTGINLIRNTEIIGLNQVSKQELDELVDCVNLLKEAYAEEH